MSQLLHEPAYTYDETLRALGIVGALCGLNRENTRFLTYAIEGEPATCIVCAARSVTWVTLYLNV